jgi:hypothetical protein
MEGTFILIPTQPWYNTPKKTIARKKTFALCLLGGSYAPVNTVVFQLFTANPYLHSGGNKNYPSEGFST